MFGDWIRANRKRRGWTQAEMAAESGIPQTTISGWETGKIKDAKIKHLPILSKVFSIRIADMPLDDFPGDPAINNLTTTIPEDSMIEGGIEHGRTFKKAL